MPASRASASRSSMTIGSSERLPLVATTGKAEVGEQEMVERRVGQHRAEPRVAAARPACGEPPSPRRRRSEDDRPLAAPSSSAASSARRRSARGSRSRRARGTSPRRASPRGACAARRRATAASLRASTMRWKPPSPFTATIGAVAERGGGRAAAPRRARRARPPVAVPQRELRPAGRAGDRLGVEAPVGRVLVLGAAGRAHREARASTCARGRRAGPR